MSKKFKDLDSNGQFAVSILGCGGLFLIVVVVGWLLIAAIGWMGLVIFLALLGFAGVAFASSYDYGE